MTDRQHRRARCGGCGRMLEYRRHSLWCHRSALGAGLQRWAWIALACWFAWALGRAIDHQFGI